MNLVSADNNRANAPEVFSSARHFPSCFIYWFFILVRSVSPPPPRAQNCWHCALLIRRLHYRQQHDLHSQLLVRLGDNYNYSKHALPYKAYSTSRVHSWKPALYLLRTAEPRALCRWRCRTVSSRMSAFSSLECFVFCCNTRCDYSACVHVCVYRQLVMFKIWPVPPSAHVSVLLDIIVPIFLKLSR